MLIALSLLMLIFVTISTSVSVLYRQAEISQIVIKAQTIIHNANNLSTYVNCNNPSQVEELLASEAVSMLPKGRLYIKCGNKNGIIISVSWGGNDAEKCSKDILGLHGCLHKTI